MGTEGSSQAAAVGIDFLSPDTPQSRHLGPSIFFISPVPKPFVENPLPGPRRPPLPTATASYQSSSPTQMFKPTLLPAHSPPSTRGILLKFKSVHITLVPRITQHQPIWLQWHEASFVVRVRPLPTSPPSPLPSPTPYSTACPSSKTTVPPIRGISGPVHVAPWPGRPSPNLCACPHSSKALFCHHVHQEASPEDPSPGWVRKPLGQPRPYAVT